MPPELLSQNLGFQCNIPLFFNTHKHSGGSTPWDSPELFQNTEGNEALTRNELHWHQLSGVHGILRRLLSKSPSRARPGFLVADEVGLGKTLQSLAILAWLTECVGRQKAGIPLPPILSEWSKNIFLIALIYSQRSTHTSARARLSLISVISSLFPGQFLGNGRLLSRCSCVRKPLICSSILPEVLFGRNFGHNLAHSQSQDSLIRRG
jgi:hypothetical protein